MNLTNDEIQKALRIKRAVSEYFENKSMTKVQAKELMDYFIKRGLFDRNHKDGLPIRDFLRHLEKNGQLKLIPQAFYEQKEINKNWYFIKTQKSTGGNTQ